MPKQTASSVACFRAYELIDGQDALTLLYNINDVLPLDQQIYTINGDKQVDQRKVLGSMIKSLRKGELPVSYIHSRTSQTHGRKYAFMGRSVQSLSRVLRHTLCQKTYRDFDIVNCHPTIALHVCKSKGWDVPELEHYVLHRDECIQEILSKNPDMDRDAVKTVYLSLLNGGEQAYRDVKVKTRNLNGLYYEIRDVFGKMLDLPEVRSLIEEVTAVEKKKPASKRKDEKAIRRSVCNKVFIDVEDDILTCCVEWLKTKGLNVRNIVLVFDGFMLPKNIASQMPDNWAEELADYVEAHTDSHIRVCFVEKPMNEGVDLSKFPQTRLYQETIFSHDLEDSELIDFATQPTDFKLAKIIHQLVGKKFVWDGSTLYFFKDHRWRNYGLDIFVAELGQFSRIFDDLIEKTKDSIIKGEASNEDVTNEKELLKQLQNASLRFEKTSAVKSAFEAFKGFVMDQRIGGSFDSTPGIIGFQNGVLDIRGDAPVFRDGQPEDLVTLSTGYDFEWVQDTKDAEAFLKDIVFPEDYDPLVAFSGSLLTGTNKSHKTTFLKGEGGNGKSLYCDALQMVLGDYVRAIDKDVYLKEKKQAGGPEPHKMELRGRLLGLTVETDEQDVFLSAVFKSMSSTDTITTRGNFDKHQTIFKPLYHPVVCTNYLPRFTNVDDAVGRRIRIFQFPYKFVEQEKLVDEIGDEGYVVTKLVDRNKGDQIKSREFVLQLLNLMIQNCKKEVKESVHMKSALDGYFKDLNPVANWFSEAVVSTGNEKDRITSTDLYKEYSEWVVSERRMGRNATQLTMTTFGRHIKKIVAVKRASTSCFIGGYVFKKDEDVSDCE